MAEPPKKATTPAYVRPVRAALYALLFLAVGVCLFGLPALEQSVREGRRSPAVLIVAPALLGAYVLAFAVYRFGLVRAGRYHAGKAFVQLGVATLGLTLVVPGSLERYRAAGTVREVDLGRHLASADPETRAMAAELARHREPAEALRHVPRLVELLEDTSPEVRRQARASLVALAQGDAGGEGPDAPRRWREYWQSRSVKFP